MAAVILYYMLVVCVCRGTVHRALNKKRIIIIIVLIITIGLGNHNYIPKDLYIYFIDVGQGDSTLIITPNNKKILIDGGGSEGTNSTYDVGEDTLVPYLLDRRINKLDYVMISHFDTDHCGGIIAVLEAIKVKNIIISRQVEASDNFTTIMKIAMSKNINVIVVKRGDVINVDNHVEIRILYPENKLHFDDLNNNSIVAKLIYNNFSMLFTGDIESPAEERVVKLAKNDLQATILKLLTTGHQPRQQKNF